MDWWGFRSAVLISLARPINAGFFTEFLSLRWHYCAVCGYGGASGYVAVRPHIVSVGEGIVRG